MQISADMQTLADIASRWSACILHMNSFSGVMQSKQRRSSSIYLMSALLAGRPAFRLFMTNPINSEVEVYISAIDHMIKCSHSQKPKWEVRSAGGRDLGWCCRRFASDRTGGDLGLAAVLCSVRCKVHGHGVV